MERRVLLASLLSVLFIVAYARLMESRSPGKLQTPLQSPVNIERAGSPKTALRSLAEDKRLDKTIQLIENEHISQLESEKLLIAVGETSAAIRAVTLKRFPRQDESGNLMFSMKLPLFSIIRNGEQPTWKKISADPGSISFEATHQKSGSPQRLTYHILDKQDVVEVSLSGAKDEIDVFSAWSKGDALSDQQNALEIIALTGQENGGRAKYLKVRGPVKSFRDVPRGTSLLTLTERYFCQSIKFDPHRVATTILQSTNGTVAAKSALSMVDHDDGTTPIARIYFGPRDFFQMRSVGFEQAIPIGVLGQIGLVLLWFLSGIAKVTTNYGVAIILFSILISAAMAPFSLISFRSMKKMQELKPHMDRIMKEHKENQTKANQEIMALYRAHKVSPLSGCLPMVLQLPIFIALFQAISHFIELRGQSFLWIRDLSLPDRLASVGSFDLNALPIIMAGAMFIQTKMSQQKVGSTDNNPMAALMSGPLFAIIFAAVSYQFPSGLVLYWLTNTVASVVIYKLAR